MKNYLFILFTLLYIPCLSQDKITLSHASQHEDFIEIGIEINKPTGKFDLIDLDTMIVTDDKKNMLKESKEYPLNYNYNNGTNKIKHFYVPDKKFKTIDITGILNYFTPSAANNSYFNLGLLKNIVRNTNLIDKKITEKNPLLYFSILDSTAINKAFPDFKYRLDDDKDYTKIDFESFDIMYAYRYNNKQKLVYFINDNMDPGYNTLTLRDKSTGIIYKLVKLKRDMSSSEKDQTNVELMIENEQSIRRIPFELKNVIVKVNKN
jgi:hypothetical protein